jgi:prevent-host-death family protein
MRTTGIAELKASLAEYLARVKAGEEVLVTDRGRPVARIVPVVGPSPEGMEDLIRKGVVRPPRRPVPDAWWTEDLPEDRSGAVRREIVAERRDGR